MNKEIFISNRRDFCELIENGSMIILFSGKSPHKSNDAFYNFEVNRNFYYLTGIERENIVLIINKSQDKFEEYLYIEEHDPLLAKWIGSRISDDEARAISGIKDIRFIDDLEPDLVKLLLKNQSVSNVCFDLSRYNWDTHDKLSASFAKKLQSKYPHLNIRDISKQLISLRSIKKHGEIECIKKAIRITKKGIESMMRHSQPGMKECQLEAYFDFTLKFNGAKHAFETIAASGINGTVLHYANNDRIIEDGDLILCDLGASTENYCADITRTFPISGKFTERQKDIYNTVLNCNKKVIQHMKPGVSMIDINKLARDLLADGCIKLGLINSADGLQEYYYHSIGHSLGLDTHDVGDRDAVLEPGMVYTCEPGLYIEEESIGIRIEDDILITDNGNINLSEGIIKEVDEIEEFMQDK